MPRQPAPPERPDLDESDCAVAAAIEHEEIEDVCFEDASLKGGLTGVTRCVFRRCDLRLVRLAGATLRDCVFERCDLSNVALAGARLARVVLADCKGVGLDLSEASITSLSVSSCRLPLATCMDARFERSGFIEADLREADFEGASLEDTTFAGCVLDRARFLRANLRRLDLSGASIVGIAIEARLLGELIITPAQAPALAAALGVTFSE